MNGILGAIAQAGYIDQQRYIEEIYRQQSIGGCGGGGYIGPNGLTQTNAPKEPDNSALLLLPRKTQQLGTG